MGVTGKLKKKCSDGNVLLRVNAKKMSLFVNYFIKKKMF